MTAHEADSIETRVFEVTNRRGLHARASSRFVKTVEQFKSTITVSKDGVSVGGTSIMGLMLLAASQGTKISVSAQGLDAKQALDALETLLIDKFGESE